jgi:GNAT superfamily N-acetyltransferase
VAVELRPAHAGDASEVATVLITSRRAHLPYLPEPRTEREIRHWIATTVLRTQEVTVALDGPRMVGILCAKREEDVSWIRQLFILPGHAGKGTGSLLLGEALARLPRPVQLWCFQRNTGARRFYERHGFKAVRATDGRDNEERTPDVLYELG